MNSKPVAAVANPRKLRYGIVSKAFGNKTLFWRLQTTQALEAGEVVEIGLPEKSVLQSAALVYLLPLFFMMLGAWLGDQWLALCWVLERG